jgi:hypothetical protein
MMVKKPKKRLKGKLKKTLRNRLRKKNRIGLLKNKKKRKKLKSERLI